MNVFTNKLPRILSIATHIPPVRGYAIYAELPIKWVRPEILECWVKERSGDLGIEYNIKETDVMPLYKDSKEYKDANELVKRLCTFAFHKQVHQKELKEKITRDMVKQHEYDFTSLESEIASLTSTILHLQDEYPKDVRCKRIKYVVQRATDKRRELLAQLRSQDYRKYEWVLDRLNLKYHPTPEEPQVAPRKDSLRKLTKMYCDKIIQAKVDAYKVELKSQQKDFFKDKVEQLKMIREEEIKYNLPRSVTDEEIKQAEEKAAEFDG